jgi:HSP20 family protein
MKNTLLALMLVSSASMANQHIPFKNTFFNSDFNNSVWSNLNDQFKQFNTDMHNIQNQDIFSTQANQYFDDTADSYIIEINVNELTKENLDISIKNNMLYISSNVQEITTTPNSSQTSSSQFVQSHSLPNDADKDKISTEFKDGKLIISIPKSTTPSINKVDTK